jgi:hypothetical protein
VKTPAAGEAQENLFYNQFIANLISYLLVAGLVVCLAITIKNVGQIFYPEWPGGYFPWLAFLASLEAMYARHVLNRQSVAFVEREYWLFRLAEWVVLGVLLRIFLYLVPGGATFSADLAEWPTNWLSFFNDIEYLVVLFILALIWGVSGNFAEDIHQLQTRPRDVLFTSISEMELDRKQAKFNIQNRVFWMGIFLVFFTVMMRLNLGQLLGETGRTKAATLNVLVYFGLAAILFAFNQYALLRGRWLWENIPVSGNFSQKWLLYALIFLSLLVGVSLVLPTTYTYGLLATLRMLVSLVNYLIGWIYFIFFSLLTLLYVLLGSAFGMGQAPAIVEPPTFTPDEMAPSLEGLASQYPWVNLILAILFWGVFISVILLAFSYYLRQHREWLIRVLNIPGIKWVVQFISWLLSRLGNLQTNMRLAVSARARQLRQVMGYQQKSIRPRFFRLRNLSAQDKIFFYYQALLRRGSEIGLERKKHETPYQYMADLHEKLPEEIQPDVRVLTDSFVEARYSNHPIESHHVNLVQLAWRHIREAFRKWTRQNRHD